jgi:hypothetical protein
LIPSTFPAERVAAFGADVPMQRAGQPEEVAPSYVFLASDDASSMAGQILPPNGGEVVNGKRGVRTSRESPSLSGEASGEPAVPARRLLCGPGRHGGVLPCGPLGVQLRMRERPGRLREGTRRRRSTRDVASWRASLIERKVLCGSGGRVASFRAPWLRRSPA